MKVNSKRCVLCGKVSMVEVPEAGYDKWQSGAMIQDAMPELSSDDRELLISGTDPECWNKLYGADEMDDSKGGKSV